MTIMMKIFSRYLSCLHCQATQQFPLCHQCQQNMTELIQTRPLCGQAHHHAKTIGTCCQGQPQPYRFICPSVYKGTIRTMIHAFKYQDQLYWQHVFLMLLANAILHSPWALPEVFVPVPLHQQRYYQRGFNQAYSLAITLGCYLGIKTRSLLTRHKKTPPLHSLSSQQRSQTMADAFFCKDNRLQHIALIDDIYTTGSTLKACSEAITKVNPECKITWIVLSQTPLK